MFFFSHAHAATSDFDQLLQMVDACDYLRLCYWQFSSNIRGSSHSTSCSSLALQVNFALSQWQKLNKIRVILCILDPVHTIPAEFENSMKFLRLALRFRTFSYLHRVKATRLDPVYAMPVKLENRTKLYRFGLAFTRYFEYKLSHGVS